MQILKYFMLFLIFMVSSLIGMSISKKYVYRLEELMELKNALNMFKTKVKFTYEPIPEIFLSISENVNKNIGNIFYNAKEKMKDETAKIAWEKAIEESSTNLNQEDKQMLKSLSKLLGITDIDGQISQIEITETFIEKQIKQAEEDKQKNEKLYKKLGATVGLGLVIILI